MSQKYHSLFILIFVFVMLAQPASAAENNTLVIFDASGSMLDDFGGVSRIQAAKEVLYSIIPSFSNSSVGLRAYAHIKKANKTDACRVTNLHASVLRSEEHTS